MLERDLLSEHELQELLPGIVGQANSSIMIISAFLKKDILIWLEKYIPKDIKVNVVSRWRKDDLLNGSSDREVYDVCRSNGWSFFIDQKLHAKVFLVDHSCLILGSSNYTNSGLGFNSKSNLELNIKVIPNENEISRVKNFLLNAFELDDATFTEMVVELDNTTLDSGRNVEWSDLIQTRFNLFAERLWISECLTLTPFEFENLPENFQHNDKALWGSTEPSSSHAKQMRLFHWLDMQLSKESRIFNFGELSSLLHSSIINDPSPFRKEVKGCVSAMFEWVELFNLYEIVEFRRTKGMIK